MQGAHAADAREDDGEDDGELARLAAMIDRLPDALLTAPDHAFADPRLSRDPHGALGGLRDARGVVLRDADGGYAGVDMFNAFGHDLARPHALALSHAAVSTIALDPATFRNGGAYGVHEAVQGHTVNCMDGAEHRVFRRMLERTAFGRRPIEDWSARIVEPTAAFLVERLAQKLDAGETCDFRREVALPLVYRSIAAIIGVPVEGIDHFVRVGELAQAGPRHYDEAVAAVAEMDAYFWRQLEARKAAPTDDLMSLLLAAEDGGRRLTDAEVVAHCRFLLPGGIETTWRQAANIMYALLTHPGDYEALADSPVLIDAAIEEGARWMPSANIIPRIVAREAELCGVVLPEGAAILNMLGVANRDPAQWNNPDAFDIHRPSQRHLTFHTGIHHCIGSLLARASFRAMLRECTERLPRLALACPPKAIEIQGLVIRCPNALPVTLH